MLTDTLAQWPLARLEALYRVAKRTGFFNHPRAMMALRALLEDKRRMSNS